MATYALQRLIRSFLVLLAASVVVFVAFYGIGDTGERPDQPLWRQYLAFAADAARGDLGRSIVHGVPAVDLILSRLPATLELVVLAMAIALVLGIPLGLAAGLDAESRLSRMIMGGAALGGSLPSFWKAMMLILVFAVLLGWLPTSGRGETATVLGLPSSLLTADGLRHLLLPALSLAIPALALTIRHVAAGTTEANGQDYVKYARVKGVRPRRIVRRHILRNILCPVVAMAGVEFGSLVALSTVTETVFAWPGMGKLLVDGIHQLDRPLVVACIMLAALLLVSVNFAVDLAYAALDPRVRIAGEAA